ncbi:SPOR domain-containing protein [Neobacillus drentensis]|uniref:SPOR domain-containing protein n=1 Tax=Neobacillus drentensis TaxID=220684 RepID=UPI0030000F47
MDKPKKGNTIKIKLNAETQPVQDEPKKSEPEVSTEPVTRVIKIDSNKLDSKLDSDVLLETAAAQESVDESFDWIIPESSENDIEEFNIVSSKTPKKSSVPKITSFSSNSKKKNVQPLGSIVISSIFAILIGTTIGIVMLKLLTTGPSDKTVTEPPVVEEKGGTDKKPAAGKTTSADLKQLTAYVIQGGFFSSKDGAKETASQISSKGVPSQIIEMEGKHFIFLGAADSIETAKSLSTQYKDKGVEGAFAKPLLLDEKKVSDISTKEKDFLETVPAIYETLSLVTSSALLTKSISEESTKALAGIEEQLKVNDLKNEKVKNLKVELSSAEEKVKAFQKSKDAKSIREAQQHLLNFLSTYYSM